MEYYKVNLKAKWYTPIVGKLTLMANAEFGWLGYYNKDVGYTPFERYFLGGDGMATYQLDGRETIALRGYDNARLSTAQGGVIYDKFTLEARYPITLKPTASIYALGFLEAGGSFDSVEKFNPFQVQKSAGAGLRIFMPAFGLLGIDFAYGFDDIQVLTIQDGKLTLLLDNNFRNEFLANIYSARFLSFESSNDIGSKCPKTSLYRHECYS